MKAQVHKFSLHVHGGERDAAHLPPVEVELLLRFDGPNATGEATQFLEQMTGGREAVIGFNAEAKSTTLPDAPAPQVVAPPDAVKPPSKPRATKAKESEVSLPVAQAAAPPTGDGAPAPVVNAASFKDVMQWMLANDHDQVDDVAQLCERWRESSPAIKRLGGDLKERIGRALEVLKAR